MTRYLLDTGIASDYMNRRCGVYDRAKDAAGRGHRIGLAMPGLGELWTGVCNSASREKNHRLLLRYRSHFVVWPFDEPAAKRFGELAAELIRIGRPMGQIDIQIAAIALTLGDCIVVTKDSDLGAVPGLRVENWALP